MPYCTACGGQNADGAKFCSSCGTALATSQEPLTEGMLWEAPTQPAQMPPPASPPISAAAPTPSRVEHRADAAADKARRKAMRPWYKRKRFLIPLGLLAIIIIAAVASSGGTNNPGPAPEGGETEGGFNPTGVSYPDQQPEDRVAGEDGRVELFGIAVTATNLRVVTEEFSEGGMCADVTMVNESSESKNYNEFDFKMQTPSGDVRSFDLVFVQDESLGSGVIVAGATKSGAVCFQNPNETGQFVLIYKPDAFNAARGIWIFNL